MAPSEYCYTFIFPFRLLIAYIFPSAPLRVFSLFFSSFPPHPDAGCPVTTQFTLSTEHFKIFENRLLSLNQDIYILKKTAFVYKRMAPLHKYLYGNYLITTF